MNWTIDAKAPGELVPGDYRLDHNGHAFVASLIARAGSPGWADARPAMLAELKAVVEQARAESRHRARVDELRQQQAELTAKVNDLDKRLADLAARRRDPSLLDHKDIPAELQRIAAEEAILKEQRRAVVEGGQVFDPHVRREEELLAKELHEAAKKKMEELRVAAFARRKQLVTDLAKAMGPVLDELVQAEAAVGDTMNDGLLQQLGLPTGPTRVLHLAETAV